MQSMSVLYPYDNLGRVFVAQDDFKIAQAVAQVWAKSCHTGEK